MLYPDTETVSVRCLMAADSLLSAGKEAKVMKITGHKTVEFREVGVYHPRFT